MNDIFHRLERIFMSDPAPDLVTDFGKIVTDLRAELDNLRAELAPRIEVLEGKVENWLNKEIGVDPVPEPAPVEAGQTTDTVTPPPPPAPAEVTMLPDPDVQPTPADIDPALQAEMDAKGLTETAAEPATEDDAPVNTDPAAGDIGAPVEG
jgi:hypothetical protein